LSRESPSRKTVLTLGVACAAVVIVTAAERRISRGDYADRWPFTVNEGVLSCVPIGSPTSSAVQAVYFRVGATTYPLNGIAKGRGGPDVAAIWKTYAGPEPTDILTRLPEPKRRDIFRVEAACPDRAQLAAERKFPEASSVSELEASALYEQKFRTQCIQQIRARNTLTADELALIDAEGRARHWPPTEPDRPTIGPIIDDGVKLCAR
jgi:hypothetical protein